MYEKIKQPPQKKTGQILNKDGWTWCGLLHPVLPPVLSIIVQKQLLMNYIHGKKKHQKNPLNFFFYQSVCGESLVAKKWNINHGKELLKPGMKWRNGG